MSNKKIAVIAAHPDDEVLGCGGTVINHVKNGFEVHSLILAEGITSRDSKRDRSGRISELSALEIAAKKSSEILGVTSLTLESFPDQRLDGIDLLDIIKKVEDFINKIRPEIVYTHFSGDLNIDHRRVSEAVITASRPLPSSSIKRLLFFETVSSTEWRPQAWGNPFTPNWFIDITFSLETKMKALEAYKSEMRSFPHPRSFEALEALARWRGAMSGTFAAEAFMLGRNME